MRHIVEYIAEGDEDYFAARLANGWVRIGIVGAECHDVSPEHPCYPTIEVATPETVEDVFDAVYDVIR